MHYWILPFLIACSSQPGVITETKTATSYDVTSCPDPAQYQSTDVEIRDEGLDVIALHKTQSGKRDELVVFMHGKNGQPSNSLRILGAAAYAGHRVIGLQHFTLPEVPDYCEAIYPSKMSACAEEVHAAKIYGSELNSFIELSDKRSIMGRIHYRLSELHSLYPEEGWSRYFQVMEEGTDHENYLNWEHIIVAGFSAGASRAAMIGRNHPTAGVVLHSGLQGHLSWILEGATPGTNHFAFAHVGEEFDQITTNWTHLQIPGLNTDLPAETARLSLMKIDKLQTHRFISDIEPVWDLCPFDDPPHSSLAQLGCMNTESAVTDEPYTLFRPYLYAYCTVAAAPLPEKM